MTVQTPYHVRYMEWDDLPRLTGMGKPFKNPWAYQDLANVMESNYAIGVVAVADNRPVGYMVYIVSDLTSKSSRKAGKLQLSVTLIRIIVDRDWQRKGVGRFIVDTTEKTVVKRFSEKAQLGKFTLNASVPESWLEAQLFLRSLQFRVPKINGIRPGEFDFCSDQAYFFERKGEWSKVVGTVQKQAAPPVPDPPQAA